VQQFAESTAYHEAGHMVAAVVLGLPLLEGCEGGIRIDMEGSGVARYCERKPGNHETSSEGIVQRENTIVARYAGRIAQEKYLGESVDKVFWNSDWCIAEKLLDELKPISSESSQEMLYDRAERLVTEKWNLIEGLAAALWQRPVTNMTQYEIDEGWSKSTNTQEKHLPCSEVVDFFGKFRIHCALWAERRA